MDSYQDDYLQVQVSKDCALEIEEHFMCDLCFVLENKKQIFSYKTLEKKFKLCIECFKRLQNLVFQSTLQFQNPYSPDIKIMKSNYISFYNVKKGQCYICELRQKILIKINHCNHYCCSDCLQDKISMNLNRPENLICGKDGCNYEINDYLILQFLSVYRLRSWNKFIYTQFCFSKKCPATFTINPYGNLEQQNVYEINNQMCCKSCKQQFCKVCWTQHEGKCNFEKLFEEYKKQNNIINCPQCNNLGLPQFCYKTSTNWQQCFVCKKTFCWKCKGQLQLFEMNQYNQLTINCRGCESIRNSCIERQKTCWQKIPFGTIFSILCQSILIPLFWGRICLTILFKQLFQVSRFIWKFTRELLPTNRYLAFVVFPFLSILMVIAILLISSIGFLPLLVMNVKKYCRSQRLREVQG